MLGAGVDKGSDSYVGVMGNLEREGREWSLFSVHIQ